MELNGMGMGIGVGVGVGSSPPPSASNTVVNPKKKRRTNTNTAQTTQRMQNLATAPLMQDFVPPPLSGFGDTVIASNPFDDTPPPGLNPAMHNGPQPMHPHHPHHMGNPQMRGMNPLAAGNMNPMMPHMSNMNSMNNSPIGNHMGHMGNMPSANHGSINNMNPMNSMRPNIPQGSMGPMNNHMNMNHMMNSQMNGPAMNSPMNGMNSMGSPMGGPIGSPINSMSPNHMASNPINVSAMNATNTAMSHNAPQPHPNHMNSIRAGLNRPHNMPLTTMSPTIPNAMMGNSQMNNLNMIRSQMTNIPNVNMNQRNPLGHMGNPMSNVSNNLSGKSPSHGMNIGNAMPQHGLQGPQPLGPKPIPESTGKVYPPDQPMVFNHQNPNAPPISPCGVCHKEVHANDQAILCESGCNFWFHRRCTGLSEMAYDLLMHEVCAEWACDRCMNSKSVSLVKFKP